MTSEPATPDTADLEADSPLEILFIDGEAIVIDKPAGLPCGRPRAGGQSVESMLPRLRFGFRREPMLVHRLDTDTSGCLLLARNPKAVKRFSAAFEARQVGKSYVGVVEGVPEAQSGTIDLALAKISSAEEGWRMIADPDGKPAVTHWQRLAMVDGRALVLFRPETGRTHQLRVHAASGLGMPLAGDPHYGTAQGAPRMMLHALRLIVAREPKPAIDAAAPLPDAFAEMGFARMELQMPEPGDG